jgi:hypothetical protein
MRTYFLSIAAVLAAGVLTNAVTVHASEAQPIASVDATAAFSRLKTLVGEWEADTSMGKAHLSYELIAGGSSLVEHESAEKMPAMLTVYHMDGKRLILTHYCMAGNQPRMQAESFDPATGSLGFKFLDATNLPDNAAPHMHNAAFHLVDANHFTSAWEFYEGGVRKQTESFSYTRVR